MRYIYVSLTIVMVLSSAANAQVFNTPQIGGSGGGAFDDPCRGNDALIGYNVINGKAMNTIAGVCQALNNGLFVGNNYGLRTWGKDDHNGGPYHGFDTPRCPAGSAISELDVYVNKFHELDSLSAVCSPLRPNTGSVSKLSRTETRGGNATEQGSVICPLGTIAVGITGRSGALVDAVGLKCAPGPLR